MVSGSADPSADQDFLKLWIAHGISSFGSRITDLAIPLLVVLQLNANSLEMGVLRSLPLLPYLLFALPAGALVDRQRRRNMLLTCDFMRAALLATIPAAALLDALSLAQIFVVVFAVGCCSVIFEVAYRSYLPTLVPRERLQLANNRLVVTQSLARVSGSALTGWLVQLVGGAATVAVNVASHVMAAVLMLRIKTAESPPISAPMDFRSEIREGFRLVLADSSQRALLLNSTTFNVFFMAASAVSILYVASDLALPPAMIGIALSFGAPGALAASFAASRLARRIDAAHWLIAGSAISGASVSFIPLAFGPPALLVVFIALGSFLLGFGNQMYNTSVITLQQTITPHHLLGRMNATFRFVAWGIAPFGALMGGLVGEVIGLRPTLALSAIGAISAIGWLFLSPLGEIPNSPRVADPSTTTQSD